MSINQETKHETSESCIICGDKTEFFFSKVYDSYPNSPFKDKITIRYHKCSNCGFVISKTHQEMSPDEWSNLNSSWHHYFESEDNTTIANQPPYAEQALSLCLLGTNNILDTSNVLDYAAGYGTLANLLEKYFNIKIAIFDKYVKNEKLNHKYLGEDNLNPHNLVINSAMFEHILSRDSLNEVNNLVTNDGVLMLHTVICENVPPNPNWFYLEPIVHTSFHTNKSMEILMKQWGYSASIYAPQAKSWFLFKDNYAGIANLEERINNINDELKTQYFHYKSGFVDYWKGF